MILDALQHSARYTVLGERIAKAFDYLHNTDFSTVEKGKYELDGDNLFAVVNEYDTVEATNEKMESHKKYIDVQYIVSGEEKFGHAFLHNQSPSKAYDEEKDFMLFDEAPDFFSVATTGMFAIFYPTDLHMPGITLHKATKVKKVVVKGKI